MVSQDNNAAPSRWTAKGCLLLFGLKFRCVACMLGPGMVHMLSI